MIIERYLTKLSGRERAALETLLAEQLPGCATYAPRNTTTWSNDDIIALERAGLMVWDPQMGTRVTAKGAQLVADLAHADALESPAGRIAAARRVSGRHALPDGAESTLPGLGIVVPSEPEVPRHELTEVIESVSGRLTMPEDGPITWLDDNRWAWDEGGASALPVEPSYGEPVGFFDSFPEAAAEHTAELEAIGSARSWVSRVRDYVRANVTIGRAAFAAACGGAALAELVGWLVTR